MAPKRRTQRRTRRRNTPRRNRKFSSKLQHVSNNAPMQCNLPSDPPALNSTQISDHKVTIRMLSLSSASTDTLTAGGLGYDAKWTTYYASGVGMVSLDITPAKIHSLVCSRFGFNSSLTADYAINKLQAWGATAAQLPTGQQLVGIVDNATISGGISVVDTGTQTQRARVGVSIPAKYWFASSSTAILCRVQPDQNAVASIAAEMGIVHLSVSRRCFVTL